MISDGVIDSVKVMGQPGAVKGSTSKHTPPHIPMGPGPFQKPPANKGEIVTGSSSVFYEDKEAAMLGDTGKMCADPSDAPVGKVMGTAATVLIGGGGSGSDEERAAAAAAAMAAALAACNDMTNRPVTGHPIDLTTGMLVSCFEDVSLAGQLPLQLARTYMSVNREKPGAFGFGWTHNYEESIERVGPGHPAHAELHGRLEAAGMASPSALYILYRPPMGEPAALHDVEVGGVFVDPSSGRRIAPTRAATW